MARLLPLLPAALAVLTAAACSGPSTRRPYPEPRVEDLVARLDATREQVASFSAQTVMDYWLDDQRVKGEVWVMGEPGSKVRINALSPAGGEVIADLACDGTTYVYSDKQKNCALTGPCSKDTIAALFNIALAPDDFVQLAIGVTPVLAGATGTVRWDADKRREVLDLKGADGRTQTIVLDASNGRADVVSSEVKTAEGTQEWRIDNTDFQVVKDQSGVSRRVPGKSRFRTPGKNADLIVEWQERLLGVELTPDKFQLEHDPGVARCK